jgi:hypothetical protein
MEIVLGRLSVVFDIPPGIPWKERTSSQAVPDCCADWLLTIGILRLPRG